MESRPSVFKRAWAMLWARPGAYATVVVLPYVVVLGSLILIGRVVVSIQPPAAVEPWDPMALWQSMGWGSKLFTILAFVASACVPGYVAARGICRLALEQQRNVSIPLGPVLKDMLAFMPVALLYFFVLGIVTFLGSMLLVFPGLLMATMCALIIPAGIDGELGPIAAIRCGFSLVRPVFGRVFSVYAGYLAVLFMARIALVAVLALTGDEGWNTGTVVILCFSLSFALFAIAQMNIMFTLLYREARAMDKALAAAAANAGTP